MGRGAFPGRALHGAHRAFAFSFVLITVLLGVLALCSQGTATAQPSVVRELTKLRGESSTTYELTDGSLRSEFFSSPIRFRDASGTWRAIDTRLLNDAKSGEYVAAATPFAVRLGAAQPQVRLGADRYELSLQPRGLASKAAVVLGDLATYPAVAVDTDLRYQVLAEGVKEELLLASAAAPRRFSFSLAHPGLTLRYDLQEGWGLYAENAKQPLFVLGGLCVFDSSVSKAGEPAYCAGATMKVSVGREESTIIYEVPEAWVNAPERVFPIHIDPTITFGQSSCTDTYVSSAFPDTAYAGSQELKVGRYDASTGHNRTLIKFDLSSIGGHYVPAAQLHMYQFHQYYYNQAMTTHIGLLRETWGQGTTWNILADNGGHEFDWWKDVAVARGEWMEPTARIPTQEWVEGRCANYGFIVYQTTSEDATYWRKFRSREYGTSSYRPSLEVTHETPQATSAADAPRYRTGDTVTATVTIGSTVNASQTRSVQVGVNATDSDTSRLRGVLGWFSYDPSLDTRDPHRNSWVRIPGSPAGFYYDSQATGADAIEPLAECSKDSSTQCTFRFRIRQGFGEIQDNDLDTRLKMDPLADSSPAWDSGWVHRDTNFDILPLPNDVFHTTTELSNWIGHDAVAQLDTGSLSASTTDLDIASWGPSAALARNYDSSRTAASAFGTGWRFSFERSLTIGAAETVYIDEVGDQHRFTKIDGVWLAPTGCFATLAQNGDGWTLTETDKSVLSFDSTGKLTSEADANGNTTTYAWSGGDLTSITAANGQSISVTMSGGVISAASYATAAGTRTVNYTAGATPSVTYFPGQTEERTVSYSYSASRLSAITQQNWPTTGQSVSESFLYTDGVLTEVRFADYVANSDAKAQISYGTRTATLTRYGKVNDVDHTAVEQCFTWNETANMTSRSNPGDLAAKWDFTYSFGNLLAKETSPAVGGVRYSTSYGYDANGNQISVTDAAGHTTISYYDGNHRLTRIVDPCGASTWYTYDAAGNLTVEERQLTSGESDPRARTEYSYSTVAVNGYQYKGALTEKCQKISASEWAITAMKDASEQVVYWPNGEPKCTVTRDVCLYDPAHTPSNPPNSPVDLRTTKTYDAFGNLLTETNLADTIIATNTYDLAGRLLTSTGPVFQAKVGQDQQNTQVCTHYVYDMMGNQIVTYQDSSADTAGTKASWLQSSFDSCGRVSTVTNLLWTVDHPEGRAQSVTAYSYDGMGRNIDSHNSTVSGLPAKCVYDARGNLLKSWGDGVESSSYSDGDAAICSFDALDRMTQTAEPGDSGFTQTTYVASGQPMRATAPDGSWIQYTYNANGDATSQTDHVEGETDTISSYVYDLGGRLTNSTDPDAVTTTKQYDLLDRITNTTQSDVTVTTVYSALGWVLSEVSSNSPDRPTTNVFEKSGNVVCSVNDGTSLSSTYDAAGHLTSTTDASTDRITMYAFDLFGRECELKITSIDGKTIFADTVTASDTLGRVTSRQNAFTHVTHTSNYPLNTTVAATEGIAYDDVSATSIQIIPGAQGEEAQRITTLTDGQNSQTLTRTVPSADGRDNCGRLIKTMLTMPSGAVLTAQCARRSTGDDRLLRQWGSGFASGAGQSDAYSYDATTGEKIADNVQLSLAGSISAQYGYCSSGCLQTATIGGVNETYDYDASGNLTSSTKGGITTSMSYSACRLIEVVVGGQLTTHITWDAGPCRRLSQGPSVQNQPIAYSYADDRLSTYADGSRGITASYSYGDDGFRSRSVVSGLPTGTVLTTDYAYDDDGLLLELRAQRTGGDGASWKVSYFYDEDARLYGGAYRGGGAAVPFAAITTDRGDVVELLDANGDPFAAYRYDAWGRIIHTQACATSLLTATQAEEIAVRQTLRCAGACYDVESDLYYVASAYYDPATSQFISSECENCQCSSPVLGLNAAEESAASGTSARAVGGVTVPPAGYRLLDGVRPVINSLMIHPYIDEISNGSKYFYNWDFWKGDGTEGKWRSNGPVSLIFASENRISTSSVKTFLKNYMCMNSVFNFFATDCRMAVSQNGRPNTSLSSCWVSDSGVKGRSWFYFDIDSFIHIRVYAPRVGYFYTRATSKHPHGIWWVIATCHIDCNEIFPGSIPFGCPRPSLPAANRLGMRYSLVSYDGLSEWAERTIANRWAQRRWKVERNCVNCSNWRPSIFYSWKRGVKRTRYFNRGTWLWCDGRATVLWMP